MTWKVVVSLLGYLHDLIPTCCEEKLQEQVIYEPGNMTTS